MIKTYIALFRGINVSGQKIIKMADLKEKFRTWGYEGVQTYIQSGNVIFHSNEEDVAKLADLLMVKVKDVYGFDVHILVVTPADLINVLVKNPFQGEKRERTYFTLLNEHPSSEKLAAIKSSDYSPEEFTLIDRTIYFYSPKGYGKSRMNNNYFENKLKVKATTRNLNTIKKLIELAEG